MDKNQLEKFFFQSLLKVRRNLRWRREYGDCVIEHNRVGALSLNTLLKGPIWTGVGKCDGGTWSEYNRAPPATFTNTGPERSF